VRAMTPWPGARTALESGKEVVLLASRAVEPVPDVAARGPGDLTVADGRLFVACGTAADASVLEVLALKPAGSVRMDAAAWLRGARIGPGARFISAPARSSAERPSPA